MEEDAVAPFDAVSVPDTLRERFAGSLLLPADPGYEQARRVHNGSIDKRPALIARCHTTSDVRDALELARREDREVSVRGGGHNVAGNAVTDGGVMIDLAPMRGVRVDPSARRVWAQGGTRWRDYNRAAGLYGLATTGGVVSTTGIGGLTLGGGEGWLMGRYGMAVDNLLGVELVTADLDVLAVNADEHPDLFWAVRGGGGNFGVVTAFEYQAHHVPTVFGGIVAHPLSTADEVAERYGELTAGMSDELTAGLGFVHAPDGSGNKLVAAPLCHCSPDRERAEAEVKALRTFGTPVLDAVERMPYPAINTMLDANFPAGTQNYWKSAFLKEFSADAIAVLADAFTRCPSTMTSIVNLHYHGATSRVSPTATAFPHRGPGHSVVILSQWADPAETEVNITWTHETFDALRPHTADRVYVNNLSADDASLVPSAYGPNWGRLVDLKRRYDPDNVFHLNHNIDPTAAAPAQAAEAY
jgi:FAD/FMN-containing dehydrogenase